MIRQSAAALTQVNAARRDGANMEAHWMET